MDMEISVLKYGGTSVKDIENINRISKYLVKRQHQGDNLVVIVSAMGNETDNLLRMAKSISKFPDKRDLDMLISTGEQVTSSLLSIAIKENGGDSISLTGFQAGIKTDTSHTKARIEDIEVDRIKEDLRDNKIVVIAGFQGINQHGDITTLGRGGSDTSAVAIAAALNSKCCEIYTDVDGIYSTDPNVYKEAKKLKAISYQEMLEMSSLGANVLETRAVELAHKYKVPIYVGINTGDYEGTYIKEFDNTMEKNAVTGMSIDENCIMVNITDIPFSTDNIAKIFNALAKENINIDMISQTAPHNGLINIAFTGTRDEADHMERIISELINDMPGVDYEIDTTLIKLSVVGIGMVSSPGVAASIFDILSTNKIPFYQVTTSEISISYTINEEDKDKAVRLIAYKFDL